MKYFLILIIYKQEKKRIGLRAKFNISDNIKINTFESNDSLIFFEYRRLQFFFDIGKKNLMAYLDTDFFIYLK